MKGRGVVLLVALLLVAGWPAASGAQEDPATTDPTVPDTTVPDPAPTDTTLPPPTTLAEEPPAPEPDAPEDPVVDTTVDPGPPATEGGPRTLTVTPHNNLVHGQTVVVRGRGWRPRDGGQGAAQCISGIASTAGCGRIEFAPTDAAGNFRLEYEVVVMLETSEGTFDCRVEVCVIGSNNSPSVTGSRFVELNFDPAGPDPVRRTVTVDPDSGLVDHQQVQVSGDDFTTDPRWGGYAELLQCRLPAEGYDDCDTGGYEFGEVDTDGHLDTPFRVETILRLEGGATHDCRTGGCVLSVRDNGEGFAEGAQAALDFDPAGPLAPPPTVTVTPSTGLADGDIVEVDGAGWRPNNFVAVLQCRSAATDFGGCDMNSFGYTQTDEDGAFDLRRGVAATFRVSRGRLDCRIRSCSLFVFGEEDFDDLGAAVRAPLEFDESRPLIEPRFRTGDLAGLHGGDRVRVSGTGGRPDGTVVLMQCAANATDVGGCARRTKHYVHSHFDGTGREGGPAAGVAWNARPRLRQFLHLSDGRFVNCAMSPCALVAMDLGADLDRSDRIATDFERR